MPIRQSDPYRRVAALCGAGGAGVGLLAGLGWAMHWSALTSVGPGLKAIAPSVALGLVIVGLLQLRLALAPVGRWTRLAASVVLGVVALYGLLDLVGAALHADLNGDDALTGHLALLLARPFTPMAQGAAWLMALTAASLLLLLWEPSREARGGRRRATAGLLGTIAAASALLFALGYLFGEPFFYGSGLIPIAVPAVVGFALAAVGVLAAAGPGCWPLRAFTGSSTQAQLIRVSVPFTLLSVLATAIALLLHPLEAVNHALLAAAVAMACAAGAATVSAQIARSLGRGIDEAHAGQLRAERARASELRLLDAIVENTEAHLVYLDPDFNFVWVNSAYARAGRREKGEFVGHNHFELYPDAENEAIFRQVRDTGQSITFHEKPFAFPDMPERGVTYWDWTLTPLQDEEGHLEGLVFALADVTDQVRQRQQLVEAERQRAELAEQMTAEINHRMKNNLTLLTGVLQMQLSALPPGSTAGGAIRDAMSRIAALSVVHEQLYRDQAGRVEVCALVRRVGEVGAQTLAAEQVAVSVSGASCYAPAKLGSTLAVLANELVTNAIKHGGPAEDGLLHVAIEVACTETQLQVRVWNSGNPVPEDFDPARQSGLGLTLVQGVATGQLQGNFTLRPDRDGSLAELVVGRDLLEASHAVAEVDTEARGAS